MGGRIDRSGGRVERVAASCDPATPARMTFREALPNSTVYINGQVVLDPTTGKVRPSVYVEDHADDACVAHLLPLIECEAELRERLCEEEFVRNGRRPGADEIVQRLDAFYDGPRDLVNNLGLCRHLDEMRVCSQTSLRRPSGGQHPSPQ